MLHSIGRRINQMPFPYRAKFGGASSNAVRLAGPEANVFSASFIDNSMVIRDTVTPANNYGNAPFSKLTFSRTSAAMHYNSAGVLKYAAHNLVLRSQEFDNASWSKVDNTVTADQIAGPFGTTTMDLCTEGSAGNAQIKQAITVTANSTYTASVYIKRGNTDWVRLVWADNATSTTGLRGWFNLSTGVKGTLLAIGTGTATSSRMDSVGNGIYRITIVGVIDAATTSGAFWLTSASADASTTRVAGATYYLEAAQLELGSSVTTHNPTTTAAYQAPRIDYNPSTLAIMGFLVEEARTNLIRNNTMVGVSAGTPGTLPTNWSTDLRGTTQTIVGSGTENGVSYIDIRISGTPTSTASINIIFDTTTGCAVADASTYFFSSFLSLRAGNLTNVGNIQYYLDVYNNVPTYLTTRVSGNFKSSIGATLTRHSFAITTTGQPTTVTGQPYLAIDVTNGLAIDFTIRIGLLQLELGAFATSVIPTSTIAVTRAADVCSIANTLFNLSQTAGTLYAKASTYHTTATAGQSMAISDGTSNERYNMSLNDGGAGSNFVVTDGGVNQATVNGVGVIVADTVYKIAGRYALNDFHHCRGGVLSGVPDTLGTLPTTTTMHIGQRNSFGWLNGWISEVMYIPRAMTNAELQTLTT